MEVTVQGGTGRSAKKVTLDDSVFGIVPNRAVLHQAVVAHLANKRQGTADTKTRSEVQGSGKKMWRQKGTGHARQGSKRAPHWRGGGIVFGPHPHTYHKDLPKQMRRLALRSALSDKMAAGKVVVIDALEVSDGRTKTLLGLLKNSNVEGSALVVVPERNEAARQAAGNLADVFVAEPNEVSLLRVLAAETVVFVGNAAEILGRRLAAPRRAVVGAEA
jgi:large subunit ribosomal protein L4